MGLGPKYEASQRYNMFYQQSRHHDISDNRSKTPRAFEDGLDGESALCLDLGGDDYYAGFSGVPS